jgi:hypothetical protein
MCKALLQGSPGRDHFNDPPRIPERVAEVLVVRLDHAGTDVVGEGMDLGEGSDSV